MNLQSLRHLPGIRLSREKERLDLGLDKMLVGGQRFGNTSFPDKAAFEIVSEALRGRVVLVSRREQRDGVPGIEKNGGTHYAWRLERYRTSSKLTE